MGVGKTKGSSLGLFLMILAGAGCSPARDEPADLLLLHGKIVTLEDGRPEVEALAVRGGRVLDLGTDTEMKAHAGPGTEVIDLEGHLAIPGFIEGHGHFMGLGEARLILDLSSARTWSEIVEQVAAAAKQAAPGEWIRGRGWHQEKWEHPASPSVEGFPVHAGLSRATPDNPVVLTHASGHASFVNARALALAGIDRSTPDPEGGQILHDAAGDPTGLLRETAQALVPPVGAAETPGERERRERREALLAAEEALAKGITSFQDAGSSFHTIDLLRKLVDEKQLGLRLWVMVREPNERLREKLAAYRTIGYGDHHLTVRAIKVSVDGALGSRGAWLLEPYSDAPSQTGLNLIPLSSVRETASLALEQGYQLCIHAIGDRANREVLDLYEDVFRTHPDAGNLRWRIEHAQHLSLRDIPRFARLGVIASMQAIHCTSDGSWVKDRLGERRAAEGAYVWQKLMKSGAVVTNGTDAPVEDVSPIGSFYAAVSRRLPEGSVFYPDQRMSRMEALRSYTLNPAYAAFEETIKGSLARGKLADITVLSRDILTVPEVQIPGTRVLYTIVGGQILYRGGEKQNAAVTAGAPSSTRSCLFTRKPPRKPVREPSLPRTRWQGMTMGRGFLPLAAPTARAALGRPTRRASPS